MAKKRPWEPGQYGKYLHDLTTGVTSGTIPNRKTPEFCVLEEASKMQDMIHKGELQTNRNRLEFITVPPAYPSRFA